MPAAPTHPPARHRSKPRHSRLRRPLLSCAGAGVLVAAVAVGIVSQDAGGATGSARSATLESASSTQQVTPRQVEAETKETVEQPRRLAGARRRATAAREHRERLERRARAARSAERSRLAAMDPRDLARSMVRTRGWGADQFRCLDALWTRESGWDRFASNPSSGAYGIPQALPASKMATAGPDWRTNPATQIRWGLQYIAATYGSPCGAWAKSQSHGWY